MSRPGCVLRATLVSFGLIFLPMAVWFAWKRYWGNAAALFLVSVMFLKLGTSRDDDSWMSAIDELDISHQRSKNDVHE